MKPFQRIALLAALAALLGAVVVATPAVADDTMTVQGTITLGDASHPAAAGEARVTLDSDGNGPTPWSAPVLTDGSGGYSLTVPAPASPSQRFVLHVEYLGTGTYLPVWGNRTLFARLAEEAEPITFVAGTTRFDQTLPRPATLTGRAIRAGGQPLPQSQVVLSRTGVHLFQTPDDNGGGSGGTTEPDGTYSITGLYPGTYEVSSSGEWPVGLGFESYLSEPLTADLSAGSATAGDLIVHLAAYIHGPVSCPRCTGDLGGASWQADVSTVAADGSETIAQVRGGQDARTYAFLILPGAYRMRLFSSDPHGGSAVVDVDATAEGADISLPVTLQPPTTTRIGGADRFAVSAALSENSVTPHSTFAPGIDTVFVADGLAYPDALAAGPVAGMSGSPLLLVTPTAVPAPIALELTRLHPHRIVIVGGPGAVSDGVAAQLARLVATPSAVVRVSGADRYATARALARSAMPQGAKTVFLVTGRGFADALSAGSAAVHTHAPIVTVDGSAAALDPSTAALLRTLGATRVEIIGGPGAISAGVEQSLRAMAGLTVERLDGQDRYQTSQYVNVWAYGTANPGAEPSGIAFVASGTSFPDALGAASVAGLAGSPLELSPPGCLPAQTLANANRQGTRTLVLVGGPAALSPAVATLTTC